MIICRTIILVTLMSLLLSGCNIFIPYQPDTQQGNIITPKMISQLKPGMTPEQVIEVMEGPPVLTNTFSPDVMSYIYTFRPGKGKTSEKKVTLTFKNNQLQTIETVPVENHTSDHN